MDRVPPFRPIGLEVVERHEAAGLPHGFIDGLSERAAMNRFGALHGDLPQ
jgi:hypothetical protein